MAAILAVSVIVAIRPQPVTIVEASVSVDGTRLGLLLDSCNADLHLDVAEFEDAVAIDVTRSDHDWLGGDDCQDLVYVDIEEPLGSRDLRDAGSNAAVDASHSAPGTGEEPHWPYDRTAISEAEYEAALLEMVRCLERGDPEVTARIVELLNWKTYEWTKPPVNGTVAIDDDLLETCEREHLDPLR